jgi:hypothetical protein
MKIEHELQYPKRHSKARLSTFKPVTIHFNGYSQRCSLIEREIYSVSQTFGTTRELCYFEKNTESVKR